MAWNISKTKRQALVKLQLRDKDGKFIEMGGGVKWYSSRLKKVVAGTVVGSKGENALVRLNKENPTHEPALVSVPAASIQAIDGKASLSPKGEPSADQTPEFEKPEAVADIEADPDAEADSDHESQLKGPQHLAANYGITETSDGNTYITRKDGESIYSPARALKVGDELISPAGADPTKPFSIGRGWATKGTERLNKDGEGPVIGKVIAISENRYAVVQIAGGHTIADRRNPEEMTDTVTVGLSNQVILATMGLKDALGDRVSSQQYAERPDTEEKEVSADAPEAQSDHEGREVPEDQLEDEPATEETDPAARTEQQLEIARSLPVGGFVVADDGSQKFTKTATNQWNFSGGQQLIDDASMVRMVQRGEAEGKKYKAGTDDDGSAAPESAPEAAEAPEAQPTPEAPADEAPEAVEAPSNDIEELPEDESLADPAEEEAPQTKATPVNDIVEGLAELEQAAEDVESANLSGEEADEVLDGASFKVTTADGKNYEVVTGADQNGDWNFTVLDENGAEVESYIIGNEENRVVAEKIAKGSAGPAKEEAAPAEEAAPEAEAYNENGLTAQEQAVVNAFPRMIERAERLGDFEKADKLSDQLAQMILKGNERTAAGEGKSEEPAAPEASAPITGPTDAEKIANAEKMYGTGSSQHEEAKRRFGTPEAEAPAPAEEPEKAPESAPEPEKAPEVTPEPAKPVEDAPAPSLVEPDAAPEAPAPTDAEIIAKRNRRIATLDDMPVGSEIFSDDEEQQKFVKVQGGKWAFVSADNQLIDSKSVVGMVERGEASGRSYKGHAPSDLTDAPETPETPETPEAPEKPLLNGEEGYVPLDGRGMKSKQDAKAASDAKAAPFGISMERRPDGLDHAVASRPEAFTPAEAEEFRKLDIELTWAQHENRSGREATVRGKLKALDRRVQSRLDTEAMARHKNDGPAPVKDSVEKKAPEAVKEAPKPAPPKAKEAPESAPEPEEAPEAPAVDPNANEDGLLPDEAARLTNLETRLANSYSPLNKSDEPVEPLEREINELLEHGEARNRGEEVGPFEASDAAPDSSPAQDSPDSAEAEAPPAPEAPRTRRARGEVVPVADADGNMITLGDKVGHPTLGPVEITNTIPGSGRVEFIDPTTGRKKSVKAARVRKIAPNAETTPTEQPTTAVPGERFVDAATGKQGFGDANGNRVLVGDRIRHSNGSTGTVKAVYTAGNGGAWPAITWDSDGKVRRAMGNVLEKDDSTEPVAAQEPLEVVRPSAMPAPAPERVEPAEEPFEPVLPSATPAPADTTPATPTPLIADRTVVLSELAPGSSVSAGSGAIFTKGDNGKWVMEGNPFEYSDANLADLSTLGDGMLEIITPAPAVSPEIPKTETHEQSVIRTELMVANTPLNASIVSTDGEQKFYKVSGGQWQFNEGSLLTPVVVARMIRLGEARGMAFERSEDRPAEVNTPEADAPVVDSTLPDAYSPENRERNTSRLRELPNGTKISPRSGEYTLTKDGSDSWSSTVDDGVYDTDDVYNIIRTGRAGGLIFKVDRPAAASPEPTVLPTVTLADIPLEVDSLVPPTVASRLEAFRRAPIGTTITSPAGLTVYTKQGADEWTSPDIQGATIKNSTLAVAADSEDGYWIFNKTGSAAPVTQAAPAEPEGVNISILPPRDILSAVRQAPLGAILKAPNSTNVLTKIGSRLWITQGGEEIEDMAALVSLAISTDVTGPWGISLPTVPYVARFEADTPLVDGARRRATIDNAPLGSVIRSTLNPGPTYMKMDDNTWTSSETGYEMVNGAIDNLLDGRDGFTISPPAPKPIPQDLESRIRVSEQAPIGTIVTSSSGESYTKVSDTLWADTATNNFKYALGEFATKLKNNEYTGNYFVQGFHVPDIEPDVSTDGSTTQPIPADEAAREALIESLPIGATVQHEAGRSFKRAGPNRWLDESTGYDEADFYVSSLIGRRGADGAQGWTATTPSATPEVPEVPEVAGPVIHDKLPVGSFLPSAEGSKSGLKRVGDDKWEMVKDGLPTGRFATDEATAIFQELTGSSVVEPKTIDRLGKPLGFSPEELNLPGGKSFGAFIQGGGKLNHLNTAQLQAIQKGYDNFIENLNTLMPEGYSAKLDKPIEFKYNGSMSTSVAFYHNGTKLTSQSYSTGTVGSNASRHFRTSTDSRTGKTVSSVEHALFELPKLHQGSGVSSAFLRASKQMYRQMGLDRVTIHADISVGGYAWARGGFDFRSPDLMDEALSDWQMRSQWNIPAGREAEWKQGMKEFKELKAQATAVNFKNRKHPAPIDFANIGRPEGNPSADDTWFGKHMMLHSDWYGDFPLNPLG